MENKGLHKENTPFGIPENYFGNFEETLFDRIKLEETLPKNSGFKIPQGYFETVEQGLFERIKQVKPETKVIKLSLRRKLMYSVSAAAAIALVFFGLQEFNTVNEGAQLSDTAETGWFLESSFVNTNVYDFADIFDEAALNEISMDNSIDEAELIDYLFENSDGYTTPDLNE